MSQLPEGFEFRPATEDDFEALVDLFNEYWETLSGIVKFTLDDFKNIFSVPGFDLTSSMIVVLSPEKEIIASGLVTDLANPPVHPNVYGCVRKEYEGQGIGSYLLEWGEERARKAIDRCPKNVRVSMYILGSPNHEPSINLFEKKVLKPIRYSWIMTKDLDETTPKPVWPEGIWIQTFANFDDLETIVKTADEAFADHWGYVDRSGDEERINRLRYQIENDPDFDSTLWFLAMDGDEIAGVSLCSNKLGTDRETGSVDTLGVRRHWRKQGLGLALLHFSFREFFERGFKRVSLGVDTQNLSGATRLYTKAGMEVDREFATYEKELQAGEELSKRE